MIFDKVKEKRDTLSRIDKFKSLLKQNENYWASEVEKMDERERIYHGDTIIRLASDKDEGEMFAYHVRNVASELIEAEIDNNIPYPKVTAQDYANKDKAKLIEEYLRNVIDYLPMEEMNDLAERTVKIQGGVFWLVEFDSSLEKKKKYPITLRMIHPKWVVPQHGVFTSVKDMDYIFLKVPTTKEKIRERYGVDAENIKEEEPEIRSSSATDAGKDMVTQYYCYYRNRKGGIGLFSWSGTSILCDMEDYQERKERVCKVCGRKIGEGEEVCVCGSRKFTWNSKNEEEIEEDVETRNGVKIPAATMAGGEWGRTKIPFYKPATFPIVLQKNISCYGQLLGVSDIDKIADQQNTINRMEKAMIDRLLTGGTYMSLPPNAEIEKNSDIGKQIRIERPDERAMIGTYDMQGEIAQHLNYMAEVYEEARQIIGVTDSYQGRKDPTASSGKAKEIMASQAADRIMSKKITKQAAFADIYELIFKLSLAYFDEPMDITVRDAAGNAQSDVFSRYDFITESDDGFGCDDGYLFSCDTSAVLASNREAMWQEMSAQSSAGALGDPAMLETRILYWTLMGELHYPMADVIRARLEEQAQAQQQAAMAQQVPAGVPNTAQALPEGVPNMTGEGEPQITPDVMAEIDRLAQANAAKERGISE